MGIRSPFLTFSLQKQNSTGSVWIWETVGSLPAVEMNHIMNARKNMPGTANGFFMKHSVCMIRRIFFHPYEKHHSTAKDASELAEQLGVQNLILYHTEDKNIARRKELYTEEGKKYFSGNLYVPEDLEKIEL